MGSGADGVATSPTFQNDHPSALEGGVSLHFDGQDDVVSIFDPISPTSYTLSTWVSADEIRDQSIILRSLLSPTLLWSHQIRMTSAGLFEAHTFDGSRITATGTTVAEPNRWYHVAVTASSNGEMRLYVDGVAEGEALKVGMLREDTSEWIIGSASGGGFAHFAGSLDEVAIFSNVLNAGQIAALASGTSPQNVNGISHLIESNLQEQMHSINATAWVRTPFEIPPNEFYDQLELTVQYDDGFIAYINGTEVAGRNAPTFPKWSSSATAVTEPTMSEETIDLSELLSELQPGTNLLSFHGLNSSTADRDFLLKASLTSRTADPDQIPQARFNEVAAATDTTFWVELHNPNTTPLVLDGHRIATSRGDSFRLIDVPPVPAGGYLSFDETTLGFDVASNDRLFLFAPFDATLADAITIKNRSRGVDAAGQWQYPDTVTPGGINRFDIETDVVINEIMYHARPHYPSPPPEPEDLTISLLEAEAAAWRYRDFHSGLPSDWAQQQHPDDGAEWKTGQAPIGYHIGLTDDINTQLNVPFLQQPVINTYYFETEFDFAGIDESFDLLLSHTIDDGAIFYLNGREIHRYNLPAGPIDGDVLAESEISLPAPVSEVHVDSASLRVGSNRLSVEVHQSTALDPDVYLDAQLVARKRTDAQAGEYAESDEEWIELYNRSDSDIDLSGWNLNDGLTFAFPAGTTIGANQYLVVSNNPTDLASRHSLDNVLGPFSGSLSNNSERIQLFDDHDNLADEVTYFDSGRWPKYADGAGSSLELRDPRADNSVAESWLDSVEEPRSAWTHYEYTRTVERFPYDPPIRFNEFIFGLLDSGEMLVDNISVVEDPSGEAKQLIQNGTFESDMLQEHAQKWRLVGNHRQSHVTVDPTDPTNHVLRLVAQSKAHYLSNHAETTLVDNTRVLDGNTYHLSFDAKWVAGTAQLRSELYHKDAARTTILRQPEISGTPGQKNSTAADNLGPNYSGLSHHPAIPNSTEDVRVTVRASDLDGIASTTLVYSVDEGEFQRTRMSATGQGTYDATIPAQSNRSIVQFYVEGTDDRGATSTFPAEGPDSRALFRVDDRFKRDEVRHDILVIMTDSDRSELQTVTNMMDNYRYGSTVIYDGSEAFYDVGTRYKGSMFTRNSRSTVGYNLRFDPQHKFRGVHETVSFDQKNEREVQVKHLVAQAGLMGAMFDDVTIFQPPGSTRGLPTLTTMAGQRNIYLDSQFENGSNGTMFKLEGIRVMQQTIDRDPESLKVYQPIGWVQPFDVRDLGDNKEVYRWPLLILNNRDRDDYSPIIKLAKTFELRGDELQSAITDVIDVDQWMQTFAMMSVTGIADVYGQAEENPHNLNFYVNPENDKVLAFPWDWDFSFQISTNAPLTGRGKAVHRVIRLPRFERLFYGHLLQIIDTVGNSNYMNRWSSHYGSLLRESYGSTGSYLDRRGASIKSQISNDFPPVDFSLASDGPLSVDTDQVTLTGKGWVNIRELRLAGLDQPLEVQWDATDGNDADTWQVTLPVAPGEQTITIQAFDYNDALLASQTVTVTSNVDSRPLVDSLRVTELNYNPHAALTAFGETNANNDDFEFIELMNIGRTAINLSGAEFVQREVNGSSEGIRFVFDDQSLAPDERVVVVKDLVAYQSRYGEATRIAIGRDPEGNEAVYGGKLSNGGEQLTLLDPSGATISQFAFDDTITWPQRADGNASTLNIIDTDGDYNDPSNWHASSTFGGTPGAPANNSFLDVVINEVQASSEAPSVDRIELFNTADEAIKIGNWYISDGSNDYFKYQILPEMVLSAQQYLVFDERQLGFGFDGQSADDAWLIEADAKGRPIRFADHVTFGVAADQRSLGRWPNGSGPFVEMPQTTFGRANVSPVGGGDFNADGVLDTRDINLLCSAIQSQSADLQFDLNSNNTVDQGDLFILIEDRIGTTIGDTNLDGSFNSSDLVAVFQAGTYEDVFPGNSTWATGDWNCDSDFTSGDLVVAFQRGQYVDRVKVALAAEARKATAAAFQTPEFTTRAKREHNHLENHVTNTARKTELHLAQHDCVFKHTHEWLDASSSETDELKPAWADSTPENNKKHANDLGGSLLR